MWRRALVVIWRYALPAGGLLSPPASARHGSYQHTPEIMEISCRRAQVAYVLPHQCETATTVATNTAAAAANSFPAQIPKHLRPPGVASVS